MVVAALIAVSVASNGALSFRDALALAEQQSPEVVDTRLASQVAAAGVEAVGQLPNPTVSVSYGSDDPGLFGTLEQKLPFLGQHQTAVAAARADARTAESRLSWSRLRVRAAVRRTYYALAAAQAHTQLATRIAALAGQLAEGARKRYEAGAAARLDSEQALLGAQRANQDVADRLSEEGTARSELAILLGVDQGELTASDPLEVPAPPAQAPPPASALDAHPEVITASREQDAAQARVTREKLAAIPAPSLNFELQRLESAVPGTYQLGLRGTLAFDLPVLSLNGGAVHQAQAEQRQLSAKREAVAARLRNAIQAARARFEAALQRARFYAQVQVPQSRKVAQLAQLAYSLGKAPLASVLQAQSDLATDEQRAVDAALQAQVAMADLEEASGGG